MRIKNLSAILFSVIFILLSTTICQSQSDLSKQDKKAKKNQEKELKLKERVDKSINNQVTKEYDRFKDSNYISLPIMPIYVPSLYTERTLLTALSYQPHIYITASYIYSGTENKPKSFAIGFVTKQLQEFWFQEKRDLTFLVDGERIALGKTTHDGNRTPVNFGFKIINITNEAMLTSISKDDFLKLANAKNVEFQLGIVEGKLSEKHLEGFRNLISYSQ